jgi:hypothetical protein
MIKRINMGFLDFASFVVTYGFIMKHPWKEITTIANAMEKSKKNNLGNGRVEYAESSTTRDCRILP